MIDPRPEVGPKAGALLLLFVALYLAPLPFRPLSLPDEFRYAEIPREMVATGDWIVPRLDGFLYLEKPVLGYWLTAASEVIFGRNRFAVRLPSALAIGATALVIFWLVRRSLGSERSSVARLACAVFLTSLLPAVVGVTALLDGPLTISLTISLAAFFLATEAPRASRSERSGLVVAGAACGLAFLTKGFLAPVLLALIGGTYLLTQRRHWDLLRLAWLPAIAALGVAAPWSALVHWREPDFWRFFFWHEHVGRVLGDNQGQHPQPWWFYLAITPALLAPWTFLAPGTSLAAIFGERSSTQRRLVVFCAVWVGSTYLLFSASGGKLFTYVLPAFPALAILSALAWERDLGHPPSRRHRYGLLAGGGLMGLAAIALLGYLLQSDRDAVFVPWWRGGLLVANLGLSACLLLVASRRRSLATAMRFTACAFLPFLVLSPATLPQRLLLSKAPGAWLETIEAETEPGTLVLAVHDVARAVCWTFERSDIYLVGNPGELRYASERQADDPRWVAPEDARAIIERHHGAALLIIETDSYDRWKPSFPEPVSVESSGPKGLVAARYASRR